MNEWYMHTITVVWTVVFSGPFIAKLPISFATVLEGKIKFKFEL